MAETFISIISSAYLHPIAVLLERLEKIDKKTSEGRPIYSENGLACSICILAVVCLESFVMRVCYKNDLRGREKVTVYKYLSQLYKDFPCTDEVAEIYVLRDALMHNHVWEFTESMDDEENILTTDTTFAIGGDGKHDKRVDSKTGLTHKLQLHVNPVEVGRDEALSVLHIMWKTLTFLAQQERNQFSVSDYRVTYRGKRRLFQEVIGFPH